MEELQDKLLKKSIFLVLFFFKRSIEIKAGFSNNSTVKYEKQGNEAPGAHNSNLIFQINE